MEFHQQNPDHHLVIIRLYITKIAIINLHCQLYTTVWQRYNHFSYRQLEVLKIIGTYVYVLSTSM